MATASGDRGQGMLGGAPESAERQVPPGLSMKVVLLLSAAVFINFVDLVTGFALLLVLRVLLGIGESVTYPCNADHRYKFPTEISGIRQSSADLQG